MLWTLLLHSMLGTYQTPEPMTAVLERARAKYGLPSICAGAILDGRIVSLDAVGVRHLGSDEKVTVDDRYHCGSNTKSFTAALFATYVQQGKVNWNTPLRNLFPSFAREMDPGFQTVTPLHLATHRAGLSGASWPPSGVDALAAWDGKAPSPRGEYARLLLSVPPDHAPESRMEYSNAGYVTLGAILEALTSSSWEALLTSRILRPLGLKSAGFGAAGVDDGGHQPWGHFMQDGKLTPMPPGPRGDNRPALGPAGTLHMSVPDLLRWCAFQADEGRTIPLVSPAQFAILHTPPFGGDYAGGLIAANRGWAGGTAFNHAGSNTMNYELMWIAPRKRFGVVVATNAVVPDVHTALDEITGELIRRYCPK